MQGWGRISDARPCTVLVHVMLKLVLREELFYCNEVIIASLWSGPSVLTVRMGVT